MGNRGGNRMIRTLTILLAASAASVSARAQSDASEPIHLVATSAEDWPGVSDFTGITTLPA
jgi:hypothetical protein